MLHCQLNTVITLNRNGVRYPLMFRPGPCTQTNSNFQADNIPMHVLLGSNSAEGQGDLYLWQPTCIPFCRSFSSYRQQKTKDSPEWSSLETWFGTISRWRPRYQTTHGPSGAQCLRGKVARARVRNMLCVTTGRFSNTFISQSTLVNWNS